MDQPPKETRVLNIEQCISLYPDALHSKLTHLFADFPKAAVVRRFALPANSIILRQGAASDRIYVLIEGDAILMGMQTIGSNYTFLHTHAVQFFGEYEAIGSFQTYTATVITKSPCSLLSFSSQEYMSWLRSSPAAAFERMKSVIIFLANQLANERDNLFLNSNNRLICFLCNYYRQNCKADNASVCVRATRNEISDAIAYSVRTVNRQITTLWKQGLLTKLHGKIYIDRQQYLQLQECLVER